MVHEDIEGEMKNLLHSILRPLDWIFPLTFIDMTEQRFNLSALFPFDPNLPYDFLTFFLLYALTLLLFFTSSSCHCFLFFLTLHPAAELTFWFYVKEQLNRHELQRFYSLRHISSELGRGRAWLRCALNEHSLERYLHMLLADRPRLGSAILHFYTFSKTNLHISRIMCLYLLL